MKGLLLLLHPGVRARAYLQMVLARGIVPEHVILLGTAEDDRFEASWGEPPRAEFDPGESLLQTLSRHHIEARRVARLDPNDSAVVEAVGFCHASVAVFSGGGILRRPLLGAAGRWLHVHPGRLPDWRGSTCHYYGILLEGRVAASAFFMEPGLDTGAVVAGRHFPVDAGWSASALDHSGDAWIRASVLVEALLTLREHPDHSGRPQLEGAGQMFYVIHPVLKHLALLAVGARSRELSAEDLVATEGSACPSS